MTFSSVYEMTNPLTTVRKQHFWDWFSGASLNSRWTNLVVAGSPTFGMNDSVDDGAFILSNNAQGKYTFNNKRQYAHDGSVVIGVWKSDNTTSSDHAIGLMKDGTVGNQEILLRGGSVTGSNFSISTGDATTETSTGSSIAVDTSYHSHKGALDGTDAKYTLDGVLEVTKTTNLPTVNIQPIVQGRSTTASNRQMNVRYMEAYNT